MWHTEHEIDTDSAPATVWAALRDLETGVTPLASGDRRALDGDFEVQGTITATPVGLQPLTSTIVELVPGEVLATRTVFDRLVLLLRHTVQARDGSGTRIVRRLEIDGDSADDRGPVVGPRISEDYPEALEEIVRTARDLR